MTYSAEEIQATITFARTSGLVDVPARILTLDKRVKDHSTAIAVIGMINRGKSTLFNRLVGAQISATSATPETAATIRVQTGPPSAWGRTISGDVVEIPPDPGEFMDRLGRADRDRIVSASITGDFRLPEGLMLIDTPGVGDVAVQIEDAFSDLDEQWIEAGAGAALVVFAVPTIDADDRALLMRAREAFPGAVEVVMKQTSRDWSVEDVNDCAIDFSTKYGIEVLTLPDAVPSSDWAQSEEYADIENLLIDLDRRAEIRLQGDIERFAKFIGLLVDELVQAELVDLPSIRKAAVIPALPGSLAENVRSAIQRLESLQAKIDSSAARKQRDLAIAATEQRTKSLIAVYRTSSDSDWKERLSLLSQISKCAIDGSSSAISFCAELLKGGREWPEKTPQRRTFFTTALSGIPSNLLNATVADAALTLDERQYFLANNLPEKQHAALELSLVKNARGQSSGTLAQFLRVVKDPSNAKIIEKLRLDALSDEQSDKVQAAIRGFRSAAQNSTFSSAVSVMNKVTSDVNSSLAQATSLSSAVQNNLRTSARNETAAAWKNLGIRLNRSFKSWFETWPENPYAAESHLRTLLDEARKIAPHVTDPSTSKSLSNYIEFATGHGKSWIADVKSHEAKAKRTVRRQRALQMRPFTGTSAAMVVAAALAYYSPVFLLGCIIAAIALIVLPNPKPIAPWQTAFTPVALPTTELTPYQPSSPSPPAAPTSAESSGLGCGIATLAIVASFFVGSVALTAGMVSRDFKRFDAPSAREFRTDPFIASTTTSLQRLPSTTTTLRQSTTTTVRGSTSTTVRPSTTTTLPCSDVTGDWFLNYRDLGVVQLRVCAGDWIATLAKIDSSLPLNQKRSAITSTVDEFRARGIDGLGIFLSSSSSTGREYLLLFAGPFPTSEGASGFCRMADRSSYSLRCLTEVS
jgi:hypothetical protein